MSLKMVRPITTPSSSTSRLFLQQDDVSRLPGDVHRAVHADADIGDTQGRRIADAVTREAHHVTASAEALSDMGVAAYLMKFG